MAKNLLLAALTACLLSLGADAGAAQAAKTANQPLAGVASMYADRLQGRKTASGKRYDKNALTAAHKTLPLGARVKVTDLKSGKSVVVRITDRGPHVRGRVIDLSRAAAKELGMVRRGTARVRLEVLDSADKIES